ncbi:MAG: diguanylate cyclase [Campylobacterota bacterium]|nr:diguanylate cyclase [Campylobacterota bacterium]
MSRWYTLHIKNEILFWFFILALFPLLTLTGINYYYQKSLAEGESKKHLRLILNQKVKSVNNYIEYTSKEIKILSEMPIVKDAISGYTKEFDKNKKFITKHQVYEELFSKILRENGFYDIFLIDKVGNIVYSVAKEADLGTNLINGIYAKSNLAKVYYSSISLLEVEVSKFEFYPPSNEEAAFISIPIYGDNKILGALAVQIDKEKVKSIFSDKEGLGISGEFFGATYNQYGKIVATTALKNNPKAVVENFQFSDDPFLPVYKAVNGQRGEGITDDYLSNEVVAAWGYIPALNWGVVAKMDLKEVFTPISNLRFYSIIILFIVSLGIVIAILMAIKHIVDPIEKLTLGVKNFANGKMVEDVSVDVDNEIGQLSKNFNDMAHTLKSSQETIQKYADELEEKVKRRTKEFEYAKNDIEKTNSDMQKFIDIVDKNVISSTTNIAGIITKVSQAFCDITGYTKEELIGKKHNIIRHPDIDSEFYKELWDTITQGKVWSGEVKNQRKDGSSYWVSSTISPVFNDNAEIIEYTSIRQDITDKKKVEELSITDQLTKLFNRLKLEEVYDTEMQRAQRYGHPMSMILLDIDHFKSVNDTYGHDIGDETLKDVAKLLKGSIRKTDIVGRWGGEEFIVVSPETSLENCMELAEKIRKNIEEHTFKVIGTKTSSFGVSTYHEGDTQGTLVKRADDALYEAKGTGRNKVVTLETV